MSNLVNYNRQELLNMLICSIGEAIEDIGDSIHAHGFEGLTMKMEELSKLMDAAFAVEGMKKL